MKKLKKKRKPDYVEHTNIEAPKPKTLYKLLKKYEKKGKLLCKLIRMSDAEIVRVPLKLFLKYKRKGKIYEKAKPKEIPPLPKRIRQAVSPDEFFAIRCGEDRVQIVSMSADCQDLLCWHGRLNCTMHLRRDDLHPKEKVTEAINFLKSIQ